MLLLIFIIAISVALVTPFTVSTKRLWIPSAACIAAGMSVGFSLAQGRLGWYTSGVISLVLMVVTIPVGRFVRDALRRRG